MKLFDDDWGEANTQQDDTQIRTTILYFSEQEHAEFKRLCKRGIERMFGEERFSKGNASDLILNLLKRYEND